MGLETLAGAADAAHKDTRDYVFTQMDYAHDREMQQRSFNRQQRLNNQMAVLAADARRASYSDAVEGARRAGLHPSVAAGVGFGSVSSGGSSPAPSSSSSDSSYQGLGSLAMESRKWKEEERANLASQTAANNASAEKMEQEADSIQIENDRKRRYDETINGSLYNWGRKTLEDSNASTADKAAAEYLVNGADTAFNKGTLDALDAWSKMDAEMKKRSADKAEDEFRRKLALEKDKNRLYEQIWSADKVQQDVLFTQMNLAAAQRAKLLTDKNISEKELPYRIAEFKANIHKLNVEAAKILHTDPAGMAQNKEWGAFVQYYFDNFVQGGGDAAKAYLLGRGAAAGRAAGAASSAPAAAPAAPFTSSPMQMLGY